MARKRKCSIAVAKLDRLSRDVHSSRLIILFIDSNGRHLRGSRPKLLEIGFDAGIPRSSRPA